MQNKRYCTKCNSELEILVIDRHPCQVCKACSCIESGYVESEKEIVLELQDYFKNELWRVMYVMGIFRSHLTKRALDVCRYRWGEGMETGEHSYSNGVCGKCGKRQ